MNSTEREIGLFDASTEISGHHESKPIRILHVNSGNLYGGVETLLITLARLRHLCPGMEHQFVVCHDGRLSRELREAGVAVYVTGPVRISRPWTVWRARHRLSEVLRWERCDLVICHMAWSLAVFGRAVRAEDKRLAFWSHGFDTGATWLERLARRAKPDFAIVNSIYSAKNLERFLPRIRSEVVYCPVSLEHSPDLEKWRAELRTKYEVADDTSVIIQVSRLERWKGHLLHLKALSLLNPESKWVCWMVGGPQIEKENRYFEELQATANTLGVVSRVKFLGQRSDVRRFLAAADIFCQPNQGPEPFGIVFIEALWAGLPVISTAIGGALEIVDDTCGFLVEPGNPASVASALQRLIDSPGLRMRLGKMARHRALQLCEPAARMAALASILNPARLDPARRDNV